MMLVFPPPCLLQAASCFFSTTSQSGSPPSPPLTISLLCFCKQENQRFFTKRCQDEDEKMNLDVKWQFLSLTPAIKIFITCSQEQQKNMTELRCFYFSLSPLTLQEKNLECYLYFCSQEQAGEDEYYKGSPSPCLVYCILPVVCITMHPNSSGCSACKGYASGRRPEVRENEISPQTATYKKVFL